jgi:sugar-phosphatase
VAAQGILFDCDGVLVDSDASVIRAWSRWARAYDLEPEHVLGLVHGRRSADTVSLLLNGSGRAEAIRLINQLELEDAGSVTEVPGAGAIVGVLPASCWAVVTSGVTALARARLAGAGLPQPTVLIAAEDVSQGKPAPDGYLSAARLIGMPPGQTVVIEDSQAGLAAGRAAGAGMVIGVGDRSRDAGADIVIRDLRDLRWLAGRLEVLG